MTMLTIKQAAEEMGVSYWTVKALVDEAFDEPRKARWKVGKHFRNLSTSTAQRRIIRIYSSALGPDE